MASPPALQLAANGHKIRRRRRKVPRKMARDDIVDPAEQVSSPSYGCTSFSCGAMDPWTTFFGDKKSSSSSEDDEQEPADEESKFWFAAEEPTLLQVKEPEPAHASCDPSICRMTSGICVDCAYCSRHCRCVAAETQVPFRVFVCTPATCQGLFCSKCHKCTEHCNCNKSPMEAAPDPILPDQTQRRNMRKKFGWMQARKRDQ